MRDKKIIGNSIEIVEKKRAAFQFIDRNKEEITKIGDAVFYFAELGMQEFRTSQYTADALRLAGFDVIMGIAGMPPAWMATWGSGRPVIGIHTEGDALPNSSQVPGIAVEKSIIEGGAPGHVEGHNTNMAVMIGAAVAAKRVMETENIKGTIKVYFAPAEEQLIPRPYFLRDGYFDGVDAIFHPHVDSEFAAPYGLLQYAIISVEFIFHGKAGHAGISPWLARNALDAATLMDVGWALMRQQLEPSQSSHRVIVNGGIQPNIIPDNTKVWWFFREKHMDSAFANFEKAKKIAEGAAIMTGCSYETNIISACWPNRASKGMAEIIQKNIELVGMPHWSEEEEGLAKKVQERINVPIIRLHKQITPLKEAQQIIASNDAGCVSWVIPTGRFHFPANIPGCIFHKWPAGVSLTTSIAHKAEINGAKALAGSIIDLLMDEELLTNVKHIFMEEIGNTKYFSTIPPGQKPQIDLNEDEMERWRPMMERFYIKEKVQWSD
jgi:aminobenzoyl-glutamate utilization protein B